MKKTEIQKNLDGASSEVAKWPDWMRSPDVEAARKELKLEEEMHPEDRKMMKEGKAYAKRYAAQFCYENMEELIETISTYADVDAVEIWEGLREKFWLRDWKYEEK